MAASRADAARIPSAFRDLVDAPRVAALTTLRSDGAPRTSVVWCDAEGDTIRVSTMRGFLKERDMRRDPRVTLLCFDPRRPYRQLEIIGRVTEMTTDGARDHLDNLASRYAGHSVTYFGDVIPAHFADSETPILCRIEPTAVVAVDATEDRP